MLRLLWRLFGAGQILLTTLISQVIPAHGTYIAAGGDADHIAVAIDSRVTVDNNVGLTIFDDHHCKILPLSDSTIFFSTGVTGLRDISGHIIFDAEETAQKVYNDDPTGPFREISGLWALLMMDHYKSNSAQLAIRTNPIIEGFFAGSDTDGTFGIYGQRIFGTTPDAHRKSRTAGARDGLDLDVMLEGPNRSGHIHAHCCPVNTRIDSIG